MLTLPEQSALVELLRDTARKHEDHEDTLWWQAADLIEDLQNLIPEETTA